MYHLIPISSVMWHSPVILSQSISHLYYLILLEMICILCVGVLHNFISHFFYYYQQFLIITLNFHQFSKLWLKLVGESEVWSPVQHNFCMPIVQGGSNPLQNHSLTKGTKATRLFTYFFLQAENALWRVRSGNRTAKCGQLCLRNQLQACMGCVNTGLGMLNTVTSDYVSKQLRTLTGDQKQEHVVILSMIEWQRTVPVKAIYQINNERTTKWDWWTKQTWKLNDILQIRVPGMCFSG